MTGRSGLSPGHAPLDHVPEMVTISDRGGKILYANPATERVSGYAPEEFKTLDPFEQVHPEDRPRCEEAFGELLRNPGLSLQIEHRIRHRDGTWRWVVVTFASLFEDPEVDGLLATVRDVTESKQALRASEERFRTLADTVPALIWQNDPEGPGGTYANRHFVEFAGRPAEELLGEGWQDMLHPDDRESFTADFLATARERRPWHARVRARRHDGEWRWLETFGRPVFDPDGTYRGYVGVTPDVTAAIEAEERQVFLLKLGDALRPLADPIQVQTMAARILGEHLGADEAFYAVFDEAGYGTIHRDYAREGARSLAGRHAIADFASIVSDLRSGQPYVCDDIASSPRMTVEERANYAALGIRSMVNKTLVKDGKNVAVIGVTTMKARVWTEAEVALVEETAERTWAAVERARAEEALLASEEKYSGIFGSIDEGFVVAELLFDDEGKPFDLLVLETNPSFDRMLRTTNAVGKRALEIWGPCRYIRLGGLSFVSQTSFIPPWQIPQARVASAGVEQLCVPRTGEEASAPSRTAMGKRLPFEGPIHAPPPEPPVNGLPGRSKSSGISAVERSTRCAPESCHSIVERASPGHGGPSGGLASRAHSPTSRKFEKKTHLRAGYGMVGVVLAL
jgi:PAS domain S-box-containing protein